MNGPFAVLVGFAGGLVGFNDRTKLRPMVAARKGDTLYVSSEEGAIREIDDDLEEVWHATAGIPVIGRLKEPEKILGKKAASRMEAVSCVLTGGGGVSRLSCGRRCGMSKKLVQPEFSIDRDLDRCIHCQVCVRQCSNDCHHYDSEVEGVFSESTSCVGCQRCVTLCPTHALTVTKSPPHLRAGRQLDLGCNPEHLPPGRHRRGASGRHGQRHPGAGLLGQDAA